MLFVACLASHFHVWGESPQPKVGDFVILHLKDGSRKRGTLVGETQEKLKLEIQIGRICGSSWVDKNAVKSIEARKNPRKLYQEKLAEIAEGDANGHYRLGLWALHQGPPLKLLASREFLSALAINPDHAEAKSALEAQGYEQYEGEWMTKDQAMLAKGYVRKRGKWTKPEEPGLALEPEAKPDKDAARAPGGNEGGGGDKRGRGAPEVNVRGPKVQGATFEAVTVTPAYNDGEPVHTKHYVKGKMMRVEIEHDVTGEDYPHVIYRGDGSIIALNPAKNEANRIDLSGTSLGIGGSDFAKEILGLGGKGGAKVPGAQEIMNNAGGAFGAPGADLFGMNPGQVKKALAERGFKHLGRDNVDGRAAEVFLKDFGGGLGLPSLAGGVKIWLDDKTQRPLQAESQVLGMKILSKYKNFRSRATFPASKFEVPPNYKVVERSLIEVLSGRSGM